MLFDLLFIFIILIFNVNKYLFSKIGFLIVRE